jgi:hypothetical protein
VPANSLELHFRVTGDATIINQGNIGISEAGIATVLVRIGETAGEIIVTAQSDELTPGQIKFISN